MVLKMKKLLRLIIDVGRLFEVLICNILIQWQQNIRMSSTTSVARKVNIVVLWLYYKPQVSQNIRMCLLTNYYGTVIPNLPSPHFSIRVLLILGYVIIISTENPSHF